MANKIADSFDWFPAGLSTSDRTRLFAANGFFANGGGVVPDVELGRFGYGKAMRFSTTGVFGISYSAPFGAPIATGFIGCGQIIYPATSSGYPLLQYMDAVNNTIQLSVSFEPNGVVKAYRGNGPLQGGTSVLLGSSVAGVYDENEYFHVESKATIDASAGALEVRINTVPVLQLPTINSKVTSVSGFDAIVLGSSIANGGAAHFAIDDLFVNDTTGTTNNTWMGNLRAYGLLMNGNGATDNFTIGGSSPAATHWQSVLNQNLDDTKFEYSPNVGDIDLFTPTPSVNGPLVRLLQVRGALRQDDATQRVGRMMIRIGATNYIGAVDQFTNQTFTFYKDKWELSPATGVTFTGSEVNGLQAGVKVQA